MGLALHHHCHRTANGRSLKSSLTPQRGFTVADSISRFVHLPAQAGLRTGLFGSWRLHPLSGIALPPAVKQPCTSSFLQAPSLKQLYSPGA